MADNTPAPPSATPNPPPAASVDLAATAALSPAATVHRAAVRRARAALAVEAPRLADCTHGPGCPVHPQMNAVHNFDPNAVEALRAVLIQVRWLPVTEHTLRQVVASLGLDWADVEADL